jgi:DNA-directed RNA polymerase subunit RPC12/RpoP
MYGENYEYNCLTCNKKFTGVIPAAYHSVSHPSHDITEDQNHKTILNH